VLGFHPHCDNAGFSQLRIVDQRQFQSGGSASGKKSGRLLHRSRHAHTPASCVYLALVLSRLAPTLHGANIAACKQPRVLGTDGVVMLRLLGRAQ
jgi:hypothetical protein